MSLIGLLNTTKKSCCLKNYFFLFKLKKLFNYIVIYIFKTLENTVVTNKQKLCYLFFKRFTFPVI